MNKNKNERQSNFEILRIFAMMIIILFHYVYNGGFNLETSRFCLNKCVLRTLGFGGKLGVELFVLITGYFISDKIGGGIRRAVKFWLQVTFYGFLTFVILYLEGYSLKMGLILKAVLPIPYNTWWFATSYFCLLVLSRYINHLIHSMNRNQHLSIIAVLIVIETVLPTFMLSNMDSSPLSIFIMLYLIGAYIRIYSPAVLKRKTIGFVGAVMCMTICGTIIALDFLGQWNPVFSAHARHFMDLSSPLLLIASICIFSSFRNMDVGCSPLINRISAGTFGVYLIHEHELMRDLIWIRLFKTNTYYDAPTGKLILHMVLCSLAVFIVGITVDYMYRHILETPAMKCWDNNYGKLVLKAKPYVEKLNGKII